MVLFKRLVKLFLVFLFSNNLLPWSHYNPAANPNQDGMVLKGAWSRCVKSDPGSWIEILNRIPASGGWNFFYLAALDFKAKDIDPGFNAANCARREWRNWEHAAALFWATALFDDQNQFKAACDNLLPNTTVFNNRDSGGRDWDFFQKRATVGINSLVGPVMRVYFAKYIAKATYARDAKIGPFAKNLRPCDLPGTADKLVVAGSRYEPALSALATEVSDISMVNGNAMYCTRERTTAAPPPSAPPLSAKVFGSLFTQNFLYDQGKSGQDKAIFGPGHSGKTFAYGFSVVTGYKVKALSDTPYFKNRFGGAGGVNDAWNGWIFFNGMQNNNQAGQPDGHHAFPNPMNPFDSTLGTGYVDNKILGIDVAPKIISRDGANRYWVLGADMQPYCLLPDYVNPPAVSPMHAFGGPVIKSSPNGPLLPYRDAAFDLAAGGACLALVTNSNKSDPKPDNLIIFGASEPDYNTFNSAWHFRNNLNIPFSCNYPHWDQSEWDDWTDGWGSTRKVPNNDVAGNDARTALSFFPDSPRITPPPGMAGFTAVYVPTDATATGPIIVLAHAEAGKGSEGVPFMLKDGNWIPLTSTLQSDLRFCKMACSTSTGPMLGISSKPDKAASHLWVCTFNNAQIGTFWRDTGLVVNSAGIDTNGNFAIVDSTGAAYSLKASADLDTLFDYKSNS